MYIVKFLKRKDAASVIVAVVLAMVVVTLLSPISADLGGQLVNKASDSVLYVGGESWETQYLQPIVVAVVQVLLLEVLLRVVVPVRAILVRK